MSGPLHESHDHGGPVLEAAHVERDLRGQVGGAVKVADRAKVRRFAGRAGCHAFVETGHAILDPAKRDLCQAGPPQRSELQVWVPGSLGHGERALGMLERKRGIDGSLRIDEGHPSPFDRVGVRG